MRREKIECLIGNDWDAVLVSKPASVLYLTGFDGEGMLLVRGRDLVMFTDSRFNEQAVQEIPNIPVVLWELTAKMDAVSAKVRELGIKKLGIEEHVLDFGTYQALTAGGGFECVPVGQAVDALRYAKDEEEIDNMQAGRPYCGEGLHAGFGYYRLGITERRVGAELEYAMRRLGGQGISFDPIVASGPINGAIPHNQPTDRILQRGDLVTMDFGCRLGGYCSDLTRTVAIGEPDPKLREIYQIVLDAQLKAIDALAAGKRGSDVDSVARSYIEQKGYGKYFGHGLGHSLGLEIHEDPRLSPRDETILVDGMAVTVEPGIYIPGLGGVRIEDDCIVKNNGCLDLVNAPKGWISL